MKSHKPYTVPAKKLGCFVARYGGEEFVVLIKGENATKALKAVEMLREAVGRGQH